MVGLVVGWRMRATVRWCSGRGGERQCRVLDLVEAGGGIPPAFLDDAEGEGGAAEIPQDCGWG